MNYPLFFMILLLFLLSLISHNLDSGNLVYGKRVMCILCTTLYTLRLNSSKFYFTLYTRILLKHDLS